jgi:hypothetical protein
MLWDGSRSVQHVRRAAQPHMGSLRGPVTCHSSESDTVLVCLAQARGYVRGLGRGAQMKEGKSGLLNKRSKKGNTGRYAHKVRETSVSIRYR